MDHVTARVLKCFSLQLAEQLTITILSPKMCIFRLGHAINIVFALKERQYLLLCLQEFTLSQMSSLQRYITLKRIVRKSITATRCLFSASQSILYIDYQPILIFLSANHIYFKSKFYFTLVLNLPRVFVIISTFQKNSYAKFFKYNQMNFSKIYKSVFSILLLHANHIYNICWCRYQC